MTCPHTHVFFNSNGSSICLDCDHERKLLLTAELDFAVQETALLRSALAAQLALTELERSNERNADQYFWAYTRLTIHYKAALKHANELAVDRETTCQKRKSL